MISAMKWQCNGLEELPSICVELQSKLKPGTLCVLDGEMGAGKTTFVATFLRQFGFEDVSSPSFSLVQHYDAKIPVYHIDLYRLEGGVDVDMLDLDYYFKQKDHLIFVEWASKLAVIEAPYVKLSIQRSKQNSEQRLIIFTHVS